MLDKLKLRGVYIVTICMSTANLVTDKKGKKNGLSLYKT